MAILRNPNKEKFTVVDNFALRDENLSLKARGLLVTMMSLPDNWKFSENGLCAILAKDGQSAIRSGLKELEKYGYLTRIRTRDRSGRVSEVIWTIYEKPRLENPSVDRINLENLNLGNITQLNTYQYNTKESNTKELNTKDTVRKRTTSRFFPPSVEDVREYCLERNNDIDPEAFVAFYESKGWKVGNAPMKSWKSAVITWEKRGGKFGTKTSTRNSGTNVAEKKWNIVYDNEY